MNILLKKVLRKIGVNPLVLYPLIYHKRYTNGGGQRFERHGFSNCH